jgi:hypothetical protein
VAKNDNGYFSIDGFTKSQLVSNIGDKSSLHLLESGEDKDGSLTHTRLGLT